MEFDKDTLSHIKEGLGKVTDLLEDAEPSKLHEAQERLVKLTYELETLAKYAGSLTSEEAKDISDHIDTVQAHLSQLVEAGNISKEAIEFLFHTISRLRNITAHLGYYLRE